MGEFIVYSTLGAYHQSSFIADMNFALSCTLLPRAPEPIVSRICPSSRPRLLSLTFLKHLSVYSLPVCSCSSVSWFWTTPPSSSCFWSLWCNDLELPFWSWFFTQLIAKSAPLIYRSLFQLLCQPIALRKEIVCCSPGPRLPSYP